MGVEILTTKAFEQSLRKYPRPNIVHKTVRLLVEDPWYPSLNRHPYKGARKDIWECYVNSGDRILYEFKENALRLWYLGPHSMLDKAHQFNFGEDKAFIRYNMPHAPELPEAKNEDLPSEKQYVWNFSPEVAEIPDQAESFIQQSLIEEVPEISEPTQFNHFSFFEDAHLRLLGVPANLLQSLKSVPSLDEALYLPELPEDTRIRLMDAYTSPEMLMFDESLLVFRTTLDDLEGFCGGRISQLMLNLNPTQQQYVDMEHVSLVLLKGAAGSGKTAIGIYRAMRLAKQGRRVLMITFSNALSSATKSLIKNLSGELPRNIEVMTLHSQMAHILHSRVSFAVERDNKRLSELLRKAIHEVRGQIHSSVFARGDTFFEEEIRYVIKGQGIRSLDAYKLIERYGRKTALKQNQREVVWMVYTAYQRFLDEINKLDWGDVALQTLDSLQHSPIEKAYDDIVVDEAQDLTPVDMQVVQRLVKPTASSIMLLADTAQTLYSRNFPWKQAVIEKKVRTVTLRKNYRSTRQIAETAAHLLAKNTLMREEYVDLELSNRQGPVPMVVKMPSIAHQIEWLAERIRDLIVDRSFHLSDFAVLCRTNERCKECREILETKGLPSVIRGDKDFDVLGDCVKILTIHSSKGLEFPVVFIVGLVEELFPLVQKHQNNDDDGLLQEQIEKERRLCYVGMTRAVDGLYLLTVENMRIRARFVEELSGKVIFW